MWTFWKQTLLTLAYFDNDYDMGILGEKEIFKTIPYDAEILTIGPFRYISWENKARNYSQLDHRLAQVSR